MGGHSVAHLVDEHEGRDHARREGAHSGDEGEKPPLASGAVDGRVGAQVGRAEQLDAVERLESLARDRRVQEQPRPDVERPHLAIRGAT